MNRGALLEKLRTALVAESGVEVAILFGSRARGTHHESSDVDVAILGDVDLIALSVQLEHAVGVPVDVVGLEDPPYPLLLAVLADAVRIHERLLGRYAQFVSGSLTDLETDLPNFRMMQRRFVDRVAAHGILATRD